MDNQLSIILVTIATIINSVVFGYVASNTKNNKTNFSYLIFLAFIIFYTIFDCIIIQIFESIEAKDLIVKIQAGLWMPLSILFLNFIYLFIGKKKDIIFYSFSILITASIIITLFSDKVILGYKDFNLGTMAYTGPWFLQITFGGILPPAFYSLYLIGVEGKIFTSYSKKKYNQTDSLLAVQLKILFHGSAICLLIAVITNVFFDEVLGYSGELHLASLSLSIQSIFLLPALIKYNFLNQPMERIGDELYLHSSDAVFITNDAGIIINLNKAARKLFDLKGRIVNLNINTLFESDEDLLLIKNNIETKTKTGHYVTIAQNSITRGGLSLGKILVIRDVSVRKEVEEKLLRSEKAHKHFIESTSDIIYNIDLDGNFVFVNNVFENISGYLSDDVIGTNSNKMVRQDYKQKVYDNFSSLIKKKKDKLNNSLQMEVPVMTKSRDRLWMELGVNTIVKENKITGFSVISRDITERKDAEKKLLQTTNLLKTAQDIGQMGSFKYDIQNEAVVWSDKLYEIYGLEKNQFTLTNENFLNTVMHPDFKDTTLELVEGALHNKEKSLDYFHKIKMTSGTEKWMHSIAKIDYNENGEPTEISGTSQDITELYSTRLRLEESEMRLQKAQEMAQLGNWQYNHKTGEIYWSTELRKIFGLNKTKKILQKMFWEYIHPDDLGWMKDVWVEAEKTMVPYSGIFRIKLKNGTIKYLSEQAEFIQDSDGNLHKTIGTVIDITELQKYQEELRNLSSHIQNVQEEERSHIAREIHDELGQNLTSINMDIDYLKSSGNKNTDSDTLNRLNTLSELVNQTIKKTRRISQELRPSILDDLGLKSAIEWQISQYKKRSDSIYKLNMVGNDENVSTEQSTAIFRIAQEALTNIVRHAEATNIEIHLNIKKNLIKLKIKDDGKGISKNDTNNYTNSFGIFGMKERASILGGKLKIVSTPKEGTTIIVELPLKA